MALGRFFRGFLASPALKRESEVRKRKGEKKKKKKIGTYAMATISVPM